MSGVPSSGPLIWKRGPRSAFTLTRDHGLYALFLRRASILPGLSPGQEGLLYIGKAENRRGLKGRCHFDAQTANHSPRKSLAVLLMDSLKLTPVLVTKPNSPATWGLDPVSDVRLSGWMQENLDLAIEVCEAPDRRERDLIAQYAPPLNLDKCEQSDQHRRISDLRGRVLSGLKSKGSGPTLPL